MEIKEPPCSIAELKVLAFRWFQSFNSTGLDAASELSGAEIDDLLIDQCVRSFLPDISKLSLTEQLDLQNAFFIKIGEKFPELAARCAMRIVMRSN